MAFSKLYDQYAPALIRIITREVSKTESTEEIWCAVFYIIYHGLPFHSSDRSSLFFWMLAFVLKEIEGFYQTSQGVLSASTMA